MEELLWRSYCKGATVEQKFSLNFSDDILMRLSYDTFWSVYLKVCLLITDLFSSFPTQLKKYIFLDGLNKSPGHRVGKILL